MPPSAGSLTCPTFGLEACRRERFIASLTGHSPPVSSVYRCRPSRPRSSAAFGRRDSFKTLDRGTPSTCQEVTPNGVAQDFGPTRRGNWPQLLRERAHVRALRSRPEWQTVGAHSTECRYLLRETSREPRPPIRRRPPSGARVAARSGGSQRLCGLEQLRLFCKQPVFRKGLGCLQERKKLPDGNRHELSRDSSRECRFAGAISEISRDPGFHTNRQASCLGWNPQGLHRFSGLRIQRLPILRVSADASGREDTGLVPGLLGNGCLHRLRPTESRVRLCELGDSTLQDLVVFDDRETRASGLVKVSFPGWDPRRELESDRQAKECRVRSTWPSHLQSCL